MDKTNIPLQDKSPDFIELEEKEMYVEAPNNSFPLPFPSKEGGAAPFPAKHGDDFVVLHTTTCTKQKATGQQHVKLAG